MTPLNDENLPLRCDDCGTEVDVTWNHTADGTVCYCPFCGAELYEEDDDA